MKIGLAQSHAQPDDLDESVAGHIAQAREAFARGAEMVLFSELSLTTYLPERARELALSMDDARLEPLAKLAREAARTLIVGAPLKTSAKPEIAALVYSRAGVRAHRKHFLHDDELPYFSSGPLEPQLGDGVALAICYELSVPEHRAACANAPLYLASVAKDAAGMARAKESLRERRGSVVVLNHAHPGGSFVLRDGREVLTMGSGAGVAVVET